MSKAKETMMNRLAEGHVTTDKPGELRTLKSLAKDGQAVQIWDNRYAAKREDNHYTA